MGTWGAAIFSDDLAADVRDDFKRLIGDGRSPEDATARLAEQYAASLTDPDEAPVFWFALAATQWKLGRLTEAAKTEALARLDRGEDLDRWRRDSPGSVTQRSRALDALKAQLLAPPPPPRRVSKHHLAHTDLEAGDVATWQLASGNLALLRVVDFHQDKGGRFPVYDVLDWCAPRLPELATFQRLEQRAPLGMNPGRFILEHYRGGSKPPARWNRWAHFTGPLPRPPRLRLSDNRFTVGVAFWKHLDEHLERCFGLR